MRIAVLFIALLSLAAIGVSASCIYMPAGPLLVGGLAWVELIRYSNRVRRTDKR